MSNDAPAGGSSSAKVPVAEICKIAGITQTFFYAEARRGRAPKSAGGAGVPLEAAKAWLDARAAKKAARAEAVRRLRELCGRDAEGALE